MGQSCHLRLGDIRSVFRLLGDCRDLAADSRAWQLRMLEGLLKLLGAQVGVSGHAFWGGGPPGPRLLQPRAETVDIGWASAAARQIWLDYMSGDVSNDCVMRKLGELRGRLVTRTREQLMGDRQWYRSTQFNDYRRRSDVDHFINSFHTLDGPDEVSVVAVFRPCGERPFSPRERRIIHFFHRELRPLLGTRLFRSSGESERKLSPRLQQVLAGLLDGEGEKQIAYRLNLSGPTVHQYVTALYRHFDVHSRGELLARWVRK